MGPEFTRIINAKILNPDTGKWETGEVLVHRRRIVSAQDYHGTPETELVIDAKNQLVVPGLIDFHTHIAYGLGDAGIYPDLMTLPNGITAAVDAGSTGTAAFEGLVKYLIPNSLTTIRAFLNVTPIGVTTEMHSEETNPDLYDRERIFRLFDRYYPEPLLGLKLRMGTGFTKGQGLRPLIETRKLADELGCPVCLHLTNSEFPMEEALDLLKEGDILCHCFHGNGPYTLINAEGKVTDAAWKARKRGVLFDLAAGRINYSFSVMKQGFSDGFFPDFISTDTVSTSVYQHKLFHLLYVMSYVLDAGMPLEKVIQACTQAPARKMGLEGEIGTLKPGAAADIAILKLVENRGVFRDQHGNEIGGKHLFVPLATIKEGKVVYKQIEFEYGEQW